MAGLNQDSGCCGSDAKLSRVGGPVTPRVREILSWYRSENPGVQANLARLLCSGNLSGTGKMVILPVDQGFEHGPTRSFGMNPPAYDPLFHYQLAIDSGCNAYAAPIGFLTAGAADYAGSIPLILKLNNSDSLYKPTNPQQAITGSVKDALQLGCSAIGYTIYPGTSHRDEMYTTFAEISREARAAGLAVIVWSYARGEALSKDGETAIDVITYAAHIAAQLGAHIIKVKPPTAHIDQDAARKVYDGQKIPVATLKERAAHVVQCCFAGRRIVIFSGGEAKGDTEILEETRQLAAGGSFGAIVGRNAFQRPRDQAIKLLHSMQEIYRG